MSQLDPPSFSISAPELEYVEFAGHERDACAVKFKDMSKVKKAEITHFEWGNTLIYNCEYLSGFSCVEDLKIDSLFWLKKMLEGELPKCPTFHILKKLTLGRGCTHCGDFDALPSFLKHCPNFERLNLFHKDDACQERKTHNDLDVDQLVQLLVESTSGMDRVQIFLKTKSSFA